MSKQRITFSEMVRKLLNYANEKGIKFAIDWVKRDLETQARFMEQGLSKTMKSKHLSATAMDLLLFDEDWEYIKDGQHPSYKILGEYWKELGGVWGGDWGWDAGHFELP